VGAAPRVSSGRFTLSARTLAVILAAGFLLVAACSSNSSDTSSSSSDEPSTETTAESAPPDSTATGPTVPRPEATGSAKTTRVALPPGGPVDQVFPPGTKSYQPLFDNKCDVLRSRIVADRWEEQGVNPRDVRLYRAAANACLKRWDQARQDRAALGNPGYDANQCPQTLAQGECEACRAAVLAWLDSVLDAQAADPSFSPIFVKAPRSSRVCPSASSSTDPPTTDPPTTDPPTTDTNP